MVLLMAMAFLFSWRELPRAMGETFRSDDLTGDLAAQALATGGASGGVQKGLWIVRPGRDASGITILGQNAKGTLTPLRSQSGGLAPHGMTTSGSTLWLVLSDGQVQTLSPSQELSAAGSTVSVTGQPRLPWSKGATFRGLAVSRRQAFALLPDLTGHMQLLRLGKGQWQPTAMPETWPEDKPAAAGLVMLDSDDPWPCLVYQPTDADGRPAAKALVYVRSATDASWPSAAIDLPEKTAVTQVAIDGQLVLAQRTSAVGQIELRLTLVRPSDLRPHDLGRLILADKAPLPAGTVWCLTRWESALCLIASPPPPASTSSPTSPSTAPSPSSPSVPSLFSFSPPTAAPAPTWLMVQRTLASNVTAPPVQSLVQETPNLFDQRLPELVMPMTMAMGMLMMFAFWKRDGGPQQPTVPKEWIVSGIFLRSVAAFIDLIPCLLVIKLQMGVEFDELAERLSHSTDTLQTLTLHFFITGVFVLHTTVSEIFTGRTLGKAIFGLKVTNLHGAPINLWQGLIRGLIRTLELTAPPLLLILILQPYRQRLGDLAARTLVLTRRPVQEPDDSMLDD